MTAREWSGARCCRCESTTCLGAAQPLGEGCTASFRFVDGEFVPIVVPTVAPLTEADFDAYYPENHPEPDSWMPRRLPQRVGGRVREAS